MAKFKKKKSEATPGPDDSKKESRDLNSNDIPETEKSEPIPDKVEDLSVNVDEKSEKDRKLNTKLWTAKEIRRKLEILKKQNKQLENN